MIPHDSYTQHAPPLPSSPLPVPVV